MGGKGGDYVLGTNDAEIARLGLQHRVWREHMLEAWRRAGLKEGMRVVDVGAGPGYAALDLAERVGSAGRVLAVERSPLYADALRREAERRGHSHLTLLHGDLMDLTPPPGEFDMAWCRWVASFVPSLDRLSRWIASALRPGGRAVFHEYAVYDTWTFLPPRPHMKRFVAEVMASWRESGGETDVAAPLLDRLRAAGFRVMAARPLLFAVRPGDPMWEWPAAFVASGLARLQELGRVSRDWADQVESDFAAAQADGESLMITPLVLEIIAERAE